MPVLPFGIVADEVSRDFREAVVQGTALGLRRYEVRNLTTGRVPMVDAAELAVIEEIRRAMDIQVTAISPGLFKYTSTREAFEREMCEVYPRSAELAHQWGLPGLIVFGFHKPGATEDRPQTTMVCPTEIVEWLAEAGERAAHDGLTLMIEPEPICWADSGRTTAALIRRAGASSLKINYDPGNVAWLQNRDPLDEFESLAEFVANVHIKDLRPLRQGPGHPEWVPAGEGMIDYRAHLSALRRIGYQGPYSLETHMGNAGLQACVQALGELW